MASDLRIRSATPSDIDAIVRIQNDAFGPGIMNRLMYPSGPSDAEKAKFATSLHQLIQAPAGKVDGKFTSELGEAYLIVAQLIDSDEVIAFGIWNLFREPRSVEEWNVHVPMTGEEGTNVEILEDFIGGLHAMRRKWMKGEPGLLLRMLCCKPSRGRMGAGSALLKWGAELADKEGLPSWLEASPEGHGLYKRFGFEPVDVMDLKVKEKWGAVRRPDEDWGARSAVEFAGELPDGVFRTVMMKRPPVKEQ